MKWMRIWMLLIVVPNLVYARFWKQDYAKIEEKTMADWKQHDELITQFNGMGLPEQEQQIGLLHKSIHSCQKAIDRYNHVLKKISGKPKRRRKKWSQIKQQCKQNQMLLRAEINSLEGAVHRTIHLAKAVPLYEESIRRAERAQEMGQNCQRDWNRADEVISTLNEVSLRFEEARGLATEALDWCPDEESKNTVRQVIEIHQMGAMQYATEAETWHTQRAALKEKFTRLEEKEPLPKNKKSKRNAPTVQLEEGHAKSFPVLDTFVDQLKGDPLTLARYVQNEIAFDNRMSRQAGRIFYARSIQRNACMTFLEKCGSPWEQCQLLVYLLRKAGYTALYAIGDPYVLPQHFLENLLCTPLESEALVAYPWVLFFDGKEWIPLFPWMKEMEVNEGFDLYSLMPKEYASADRWLLRYTKGDQRISKHSDAGGDDTLGILFLRFVEEELGKQGLSLSDVGIHPVQIKRQFTSWVDFPRPATTGFLEVFESLNKDSLLFSKVQVDIASHDNPEKKTSIAFPIADLNNQALALHFTPDQKLLLGENLMLDLDESDRMIDVRVSHEYHVGPNPVTGNKTFFLSKGTEAALCFYTGESSSPITSQYYERLSSEEADKTHLLAFIGAAYFEKHGRAQEILAQLHKSPSIIDLGFGLVKLSAQNTPQIDLSWQYTPLPPGPREDLYFNLQQLLTLTDSL